MVETHIEESFTDISTQDVFDLLLLESTLDDQALRTIHRPGSTQFGK
jgi:hypothetical protein